MQWAQAHTFRLGLTQEQTHEAGKMGRTVVGRAKRPTCRASHVWAQDPPNDG